MLFFVKYEINYKEQELVRLGEVCEIKSGLILARKESKNRTPHKYNIFTLKSFLQDGFIDKKMLDSMFTEKPLDSTYLTQKGDIIIRLSKPYTATLINKATENLVFTSNFICVQSSEVIYPEYLLWVLNSTFIQEELRKSSFGSNYEMVKASTYANLEIELPSLDHQYKMGELYKLSLQEIQLLELLAKQKRTYTNSLLDLHINNKNMGVKK